MKRVTLMLSLLFISSSVFGFGSLYVRGSWGNNSGWDSSNSKSMVRSTYDSRWWEVKD